jgi:hypothetical protein
MVFLFLSVLAQASLARSAGGAGFASRSLGEGLGGVHVKRDYSLTSFSCDPSQGSFKANQSSARFTRMVFLFLSVLAQVSLTRPAKNKNPTARSCGIDLLWRRKRHSNLFSIILIMNYLKDPDFASTPNSTPGT